MQKIFFLAALLFISQTICKICIAYLVRRFWEGRETPRWIQKKVVDKTSEAGICDGNSVWKLWIHNIRPGLLCLAIITLFSKTHPLSILVFLFVFTINVIWHGRALGILLISKFSAEQIAAIIIPHGIPEIFGTNL